MPTPDDETTELVLELNRLTQAGELRWEATKMDYPYEGSRLIAAFTAVHLGRTLRLYCRVGPEQAPRSLTEALAGKAPDMISVQRSFLQLVEGERVAWQFPAVGALSDLYKTVSYTVSGVGEFIDQVLKRGVSPAVIKKLKP